MSKKKRLNPVLERVLSRLEVVDKEDLGEMRAELVSKQKRMAQTIKVLSKGLRALESRVFNEQDKEEVLPENKISPELKDYLLKRVKILLKT